MKKIILIVFFAAASLFSKLNANAQITLEHTYDSTSFNLYMVDLEVDGMKYIFRDIFLNNRIVLYNLDHSIFKIIPFPNGWLFPSAPLLYVSQHLFNSDDKIEYMLIRANGNNFTSGTAILNEDGVLIFFGENQGPWVAVNVPQAQAPIYNTPNGTKMILSLVGNFNKTFVYSLPGTLTNSIEPVGLSSDDLAQLKAFPNPNDGNATIEFKLPQGIHSGEIVLFNIDGSEIKRFLVDDTFGNLVLSNSGLSSGTYTYQLIAGNKAIDAKKMIVIR